MARPALRPLQRQHRVRERHHGVADEGELGLELGVLPGEPLGARAGARVVGVEGGGGGAAVLALEVVLPELWAVLGLAGSPTNQGFLVLVLGWRPRKYSSNPCTSLACGCREMVPSTTSS